MATNETTTSYIELSNQGSKLYVEATATAQKHFLDYLRSISEVLARPYSPATFDGGLRESFDRAGQIHSITVTAVQTTSQKNAEFAEKAAAHVSKVQDSVFHSARGLWSTGLSNLNYVKDTTNAQLDTFAKRVDEIQTRAAAAATAAGTASKN